MDALTGVFVVAGVAIGTFAIRVTPFLIGSRVKFPALFVEWLILVSLGITAGLVSRSLFISKGKLSLDDLPVNLLAVGLAAAAQRKWGNMLLSLACGVGAATAAKFLLPGR